MTPDKPEVQQIADALGMDPDTVVGKLVRLWIWADQQTYDGNAGTVTRALLDRIAGQEGFTNAMILTPWLDEKRGRLVFPNFARHNGKSAKTRALAGKRQQEHRANMSRPERDESVTREEKRREEKSVDHRVSSSKKEANTVPMIDLESFAVRYFAGPTGVEGPFTPRHIVDPGETRTLLLKLSALARAGKLGEGHLQSGLESIRHHTGEPIEDKAAYLATVLRDEVPGFDAMLAATELPQQQYQ